MDKLEELYSDNKEYILFFVLLIVLLVSLGLVSWYFSDSLNKVKSSMEKDSKTELKEEVDSDMYIVDIKGAVQRNGVYEIEKGKRVIDVINKAGGLSSNADTSVNNLSMKVEDEMVIIIYTKKEIQDFINTKKKEEAKLEKCVSDEIVNNSCIKEENKENKEDKNKAKETTSKEKENMSKEDKSLAETKEKVSSNKKISINTASKEELMTLTGIGESKANAIIDYRNSKKFETIEDIKQVQGIGEALFEKIKENITT